jgi:hypothetical protein
MFIPDPNFYPSRIPDPGPRISYSGSRIQQREQKRSRKKFILLYYISQSHFKWLFYAQDNLGVKKVLALSKYPMESTII